MKDNTREQLTHSIFDFNNITKDNFICKDYTEINYKELFKDSRIQDIINDKQKTEYVNVYENTLIEELSQRIYRSPKYWDIILLVNKKDPLFSMCYNYDVISNFVEDLVSDYLSRKANEGYSGFYTDKTVKRLLIDFEKPITDKNEEFRTVKIIKPTYLQEFLKVVYTVIKEAKNQKLKYKKEY